MTSPREFLFSNIACLRRDWQHFIEQFGIDNPEALLETCRIPYRLASQISISLSTHCNYDCAFCFNHHDRYYSYYPPVTFSEDEVVALVLHNAPINELAFAVCGEPFIHAGIFQIMERLRPAVGKYTFSTNAGLLSPEKSKRLVDFPIGRIVISAEGCDEISYAMFRRNGSIKVFRRNTTHVAELFGDKVEVASVLFRENADILLSMPAFCRELGVKRYNIMPINDHQKTRSRGFHRLNRKEMKAFTLRLLDACDTVGVSLNLNHMVIDFETAEYIRAVRGATHFDSIEVYRGPCPIALGTLLYDPRGRISFCCAMEAFHVEGGGTSFRNYYNSREARIMRVMSLLGCHSSICRTYCHKVNRKPGAISVELLKDRLQRYLLSSLPYVEVSEIPLSEKLVLWPFGSDCRRLLSKGYFDHHEVLAVFDKDPDRSLPVIAALFCRPDQVVLSAADAIVVTSSAYRPEIIKEAIEKAPPKGIRLYWIDGNERIFSRRIAPDTLSPDTPARDCSQWGVA